MKNSFECIGNVSYCPEGSYSRYIPIIKYSEFKPRIKEFICVDHIDDLLVMRDKFSFFYCAVDCSK